MQGAQNVYPKANAPKAPEPKPAKRSKRSAKAGAVALLLLPVLLVLLALPLLGCSSGADGVGGVWPFGSQGGGGSAERGDRAPAQAIFVDAPTYVQGSPATSVDPSTTQEGSLSEGARSGTGGAASTATQLQRARAAIDEAEAALKASQALSPPAGR